MTNPETLYRLALDLVLQIPGGKRDMLAVLAEAERIANKLEDNEDRLSGVSPSLERATSMPEPSGDKRALASSFRPARFRYRLVQSRLGDGSGAPRGVRLD